MISKPSLKGLAVNFNSSFNANHTNWYAEVGNRKMLAVVDCTGHGVPGEFMSMLGFALLDQIVVDKKVQENK